MDKSNCIWHRSDDGCHWCGLSNSALVCGHCKQYRPQMYDRVFRFKRILNDGTFFFAEKSGYSGIDEVFLSAHTIAKVEIDLNRVDLYEGEKLLATFYRVIY